MSSIRAKIEKEQRELAKDIKALKKAAHLLRKHKEINMSMELWSLIFEKNKKYDWNVFELRPSNIRILENEKKSLKL